MLKLLVATLIAVMSTPAFAQEPAHSVVAISAAVTEAQLVEKHSEAIALGRSEYVENAILSIENFVTGRFSGRDDAWKRERAGGYFDDALSKFFRSVDNDSLGRLVERSPVFSQYLVAFPDDFPLAIELEMEIEIAEKEVRIAEKEVRIVAFQELIKTLSSVKQD
jgi:hypothetical protein